MHCQVLLNFQYIQYVCLKAARIVSNIDQLFSKTLIANWGEFGNNRISYLSNYH